MALNLVNGILIEGVDYAGKTSVAKKLLQEIRKKGKETRYNKDYLLKDNPLVKLFIKKGDAISPPNILQDIYYITAKLIEKEYYRQERVFIIQDRYLFSTLNHISFFYLNKNKDILKLYEVGLHFKKNIYLTCSLESKKERCHHDPPKDPFDRFLFSNINLFQEYDEFCLSNVPKDESWIIINTDNLSIDEIAKKVLCFIGKDL